MLTVVAHTIHTYTNCYNIHAPTLTVPLPLLGPAPEPLANIKRPAAASLRFASSIAIRFLRAAPFRST